jgi:peptidoglycan-associated lipoprotein
MLRKSLVRLVLLISLCGIAFIAAGCAKKQVIKEQEAARPVIEGKQEEFKPEPAKGLEKPEEETPQPAEAAASEKPKEEAEEEAKIELREESITEARTEQPKEEAKEEAKIELVEESITEARAEEEPAPLDLAGLRIQFAFDDYNLSNQAKENLEKIAFWMSKNPTAKIRIEGYTCEIGTNEYNVALGDRRANGAKRYLEALGVSSGRISTISYGEERPSDPDHTEEARSRNRRDEFLETK